MRWILPTIPGVNETNIAGTGSMENPAFSNDKVKKPSLGRNLFLVQQCSQMLSCGVEPPQWPTIWLVASERVKTIKGHEHAYQGPERSSPMTSHS
ncbi:hypothetical protein VNO77_01400 [Canavalia gladiata]|uniref:Uncharacterized protein n=1 Tax=Canavalia gladiata TaxID=3824 RepID=A0AAN9MR27_CANGL